jgi:hypothetical protein
MTTLLLPFLFVALFITEIFLVQFEKFGWTTFSLIATAVAVYHFKLFGIPTFIVSHPSLCLGFIAAYIVIGIIWSFIKWYSYLLSFKEKFVDKKDKLLSTKKALVEAQSNWIQDNHIEFNNQPINLESLPFENYGVINEKFITSNKNHDKLTRNYGDAVRAYNGFYKPEVASHKGDIIAWMCFWPFSLIGTFINDPVRRLFNFIFNSLKGTYQKMSDSVFSDFPNN